MEVEDMCWDIKVETIGLKLGISSKKAKWGQEVREIAKMSSPCLFIFVLYPFGYYVAQNGFR